MIFIQKAQVLALMLLLSPPCYNEVDHKGFMFVGGRKLHGDHRRQSKEEGRQENLVKQKTLDVLQEHQKLFPEEGSRNTTTTMKDNGESPKSPRIISGSDVPPNEYNWFARGVYKSYGEDVWRYVVHDPISYTYTGFIFVLNTIFFNPRGCGGSLITPEFVLTAVRHYPDLTFYHNCMQNASHSVSFTMQAHCSFDESSGFQIGTSLY